MIKLLKKVFGELEKLPDDQQDHLAQEIQDLLDEAQYLKVAEESLAEEGDNISLEDIKKDLGL